MNGTILIRGGTVVDGTGAPGFVADVEVRDGRLRVIRQELEGERAEEGPEPGTTEVIDATGKVVAPGFIDLHSHSGLMILREPRHEPKVRQGVTTELVGIDGLGYAPFRSRDDLDALIEMNAGLDGTPPDDEPRTWHSMADYLGRFDGRVSVNIATLVGNTPLRIDALGWDDVPADDRAIDRMQGTLREAMEDGAFGLSSGLDYPPGAYATTEELTALTREAGRNGGFYHSHVRYALGDRFLDPFREAVEIGRRSGAPAHITHFYHRLTFPGTPEQMLAVVDAARAVGQDVTFDSYPYEWASTRLLILIPIWVQEGGPGPTKERLAERGVRERIRDDLTARGVIYAGAGGLADVRLGAFQRPQNLRWEGRTLGDVQAETGRDIVDLLCDLLLEENLAINEVTPGPHTDGIRRFYQHASRDGRHGLHLRRRQAEPQDIRQLPADPRPVRPRRGAPDPRGRGEADDLDARGPPRPPRPRRDPGRRDRRPRRLRPRHRPGDGDLRRATPVPDRHRPRPRRRRAGRP